MRQVPEILRLKYERRLPHRTIARARGVRVGTVCAYFHRAQQAGLTCPLPAEWDDAQLEARLFRRVGDVVGAPRPMSDMAWLHRGLKRPSPMPDDSGPARDHDAHARFGPPRTRPPGPVPGFAGGGWTWRDARHPGGGGVNRSCAPDTRSRRERRTPAARDQIRIVGSSKSRSQSPRMLMASTVAISTAPGKVANHHAMAR